MPEPAPVISTCLLRRAIAFTCRWKLEQQSAKKTSSLVAEMMSAVAANHRKDLPGDVARAARRRHEHKGGREFLRLRRPFHRRIGPEFLDLLGRAVGGIEWCPHRTRCNGVHANASVHEVARQ